MELSGRVAGTKKVLNRQEGLAQRSLRRQACRGVVGGLAQLARAPALQAGGHRFDSDILHRSLKWKSKSGRAKSLKAESEKAEEERKNMDR